MERTNFRYVTHEEIPEEIDFASVDVSFISLKLIIPVMRNLLKDKGRAVCLIKPQFEAGKDKIGKKGVVRDIETHYEVVQMIYDFVLENGFMSVYILSVIDINVTTCRTMEDKMELIKITSAQNDAVKHLVKLRDRRKRDVGENPSCRCRVSGYRHMGFRLSSAYGVSHLRSVPRSP
jgi:hypothetical protein